MVFLRAVSLATLWLSLLRRSWEQNFLGYSATCIIFLFVSLFVFLFEKDQIIDMVIIVAIGVCITVVLANYWNYG